MVLRSGITRKHRIKNHPFYENEGEVYFPLKVRLALSPKPCEDKAVNLTDPANFRQQDPGFSLDGLKIRSVSSFQSFIRYIATCSLQ